MSTEQMSSELLNDKINTLTLELSKLKDLEEKKDIELARVQRIIDEHSQISMLLRQKVEGSFFFFFCSFCFDNF